MKGLIKNYLNRSSQRDSGVRIGAHFVGLGQSASFSYRDALINCQPRTSNKNLIQATYLSSFSLTVIKRVVKKIRLSHDGLG